MNTPRHPAELTNDALQSECDVRRLKRGGPGGQHRNKVETAIVLTHRPTGFAAEANERRSQTENLQIALFRLRILFALGIRRELGGKPSVLWVSRRHADRIRVSERHDDFPSLLAEALDAVAAADWHIPEAASSLGISASQLVKFLKLEPQALAMVNRERESRELRPLR